MNSVRTRWRLWCRAGHRHLGGESGWQLQLHILCAVAELEREIIRERVNAGLAAAKKRGVKFGRPATLDAHRDNIARLRVIGRTGRAIAAELSLPVGSFQIIREFRLAA